MRNIGGEMSTKNRTIRIPKLLDDQIHDRALLHRRSVNKEIMYMLEQQIDQSVESDRRVMKSMSDLTRPESQSPEKA